MKRIVSNDFMRAVLSEKNYMHSNENARKITVKQYIAINQLKELYTFSGLFHRKPFVRKRRSCIRHRVYITAGMHSH